MMQGISNTMAAPSAAYAVDLCQHLAECETNYLRLSKLMPDRCSRPSRLISISLGTSRELQIRLSVLDEAPYTSTLVMRQSQRIWGAQVPEMTVRAYHDARMAEVIAYQNIRAPKAVYSYPNPRMHAPDEKRQLNLLLGEWLSMCLVHGHESEPVTVVQA